MRTVFYDVNYICQQCNRAEIGKVTTVRIEKGVRGADEMLAYSWRMKTTNISRDQQSFEEGIKNSKNSHWKQNKLPCEGRELSNPVEQRGACGHWDRNLRDKTRFRERYLRRRAEPRGPATLSRRAHMLRRIKKCPYARSVSVGMMLEARAWCLQSGSICEKELWKSNRAERVVCLCVGRQLRRTCFLFSKTLSLPTALSEEWYLTCPIS